MLSGIALAVGLCPSQALGELPIIDVHGHLQAGMSAENLIRLMDETGVQAMVLMATWGSQGGTDEQSLAYARRYPGRFIPFVGFQNRRPLHHPPGTWLDPTSTTLEFLDYVEKRLSSGEFRGLGEIMLRYHGHASDAPEVDHPVGSRLMFRIAELAGKYRVPILIHAEGEAKVVAGMEQVLRSYPSVTAIWAHNCGRQSAEAIARLLGDYPNLHCDLGGMTFTQPFGYGAGWPHFAASTFRIEDGSGRLLPDMKSLFERFPDRFMLGMDVYYLGSYQYFAERVARFRQLLAQLSPAAARNLAYENAQRVLRLPATPR
jgi:predicted TIM-barrel fold metal-dependent hydrolase